MRPTDLVLGLRLGRVSRERRFHDPTPSVAVNKRTKGLSHGIGARVDDALGNEGVDLLYELVVHSRHQLAHIRSVAHCIAIRNALFGRVGSSLRDRLGIGELEVHPRVLEITHDGLVGAAVAQHRVERA